MMNIAEHLLRKRKHRFASRHRGRTALWTGLLAAGALAAAAGGSVAQDVSGRIELTYGHVTTPATSLSALFGPTAYDQFSTNARLRWQHRWGDVSATFHYRLSVESGPGVSISRAIAATMPPPPPGNILNMERTYVDSGNHRTTGRVDRLWLGYTSPDVVLRVGRQALTWGAGMVFHPMDIVAPFSPGAQDTEFKPGTDMVYAQWLLPSGSDVELIAVPRRAVAGGPATAKASTFALRFEGEFGDLGTEVILARDHGDLTAGLGLSGPLGGATWNVEVVPTRLASGATRTSALANISNAVQIMDRNTLIFAEYFHNGFGMPAAATSLLAMPAALNDRLARGQVFSLKRNYLATGFNMDWSPLVTVGANAIVNLDDKSALAVAQVNWSLSDNSNLIFGARVPVGPRGTEFGGMAPGLVGPPWAVPDRTLFVQFRQYF